MRTASLISPDSIESVSQKFKPTVKCASGLTWTGDEIGIEEEAELADTDAVCNGNFYVHTPPSSILLDRETC